MRNTLYHLILLLYCLVISSTALSQLPKIYFHPKAPGNEKQSNIVDSIRFIPLEPREGIELNSYASIDVTTSYYLIYDYSNQALLLYAKNGRFIKKISYKNYGYPVYDAHHDQLVLFGNNKNYTLTSRDRIKIKLDWNNPRNRKYYKKYTIDLSDTFFTFKKAIPQQKDILQAYPFYDDVYNVREITTSELYKDSLDYEFKLYRGDQFIKGFFPYNRIHEPRFLYTTEAMAINNTDTPYIHFITRPFCDTIYKTVRDSLFPCYQMVFPLENSLPASFYTTPFKNRTERENYDRNNGWKLHQVYSFYENTRFIYFTVGYLNNHDSYLYQKQTNTTYKVKNIRSDSSQYNLSLLTEYGLTRKLDKFYKTQKAGDILAFFEKNKEVPIPPALEAFINSNPPANTPVIIEFKFKN